MTKKREPDPVRIPPMKCLAYGIEVDQETYRKYLSTFGTPNQMTLEEVKAHEIVREKKGKKKKAKDSQVSSESEA